MAHLLNTQAMWDFQHSPSCVAGGHPSQHVQQMGDGGPQPIGPGSDTMKTNGCSLEHFGGPCCLIYNIPLQCGSYIIHGKCSSIGTSYDSIYYIHIKGMVYTL